MTLAMTLRSKIEYVRDRMKRDTLENVIWLVNIVPKLFGFSLLEEKLSAPFWIVHFFLLFYIYILGGMWYMVKYSKSISEYVTIVVNMSIVIMTLTNSYWWLRKRPLVNSVLMVLKMNNELVSKKDNFQQRLKKIISNIRNIVLVFYGCIYMSELVNYLPNRVNITNEYAMTPCVGLLKYSTQSPNREVCLIMLFTQECSIMITVLNFQALILLLIAHTAAMYQILSEELMELNNYENIGEEYDSNVKERLKRMVDRHSLILKMIGKLRILYSMPIGVNFASNAICIMLFFGCLSKEELVKFLPVILYCFLVFFLYCYLGQRLINAAETFEIAVYSCGWENFKLNDKQKIYNMLVQSQKPVHLLAADIIPINIATFASTCQLIYKFVTVVKL